MAIAENAMATSSADFWNPTRCAPSEHGELVAEDQDLDPLGGVGSDAQHDPAQELGDHLVDQPERHQRIMPGHLPRRTGTSRAVRAVLGTHTILSTISMFDRIVTLFGFDPLLRVGRSSPRW